MASAVASSTRAAGSCARGSSAVLASRSGSHACCGIGEIGTPSIGGRDLAERSGTDINAAGGEPSRQHDRDHAASRDQRTGGCAGRQWRPAPGADGVGEPIIALPPGCGCTWPAAIPLCARACPV